MKKRKNEPASPDIQKVIDEIESAIEDLKKNGIIRYRKDIDEAFHRIYGMEKITSHATSPQRDMDMETRKKVRDFIKDYPTHRAIFWAVSPDLEIWDQATFCLKKKPNENNELIVKAKGLFRADTNIECEGNAVIYPFGHLELEVSQPSKRKSFFIGCFQNIRFEQSPNLGLIVGHYLAVSGAKKAEYPITSRPMLLFPISTAETVATKYKEWLLKIKRDEDWWRTPNSIWFEELEKLSALQ